MDPRASWYREYLVVSLMATMDLAVKPSLCYTHPPSDRYAEMQDYFQLVLAHDWNRKNNAFLANPGCSGIPGFPVIR